MPGLGRLEGVGLMGVDLLDPGLVQRIAQRWMKLRRHRAKLGGAPLEGGLGRELIAATGFEHRPPRGLRPELSHRLP
jgi:hypothetical protein